MLLLVHFNSVAQLQSYKKGLASFEKGFYEQAILELKKVEVIDEKVIIDNDFDIVLLEKI